MISFASRYGYLHNTLGSVPPARCPMTLEQSRLLSPPRPKRRGSVSLPWH
ncbi:hypothetical protein AG1IA_08333 [Rhizoctonia solani AG-1 IA]|uniref:Uncharacterized protein n=1 Tax=Thanatephorus cucumeris (strain AG1-IA) TaxID=983506 RepID=L8WI85_THACA|nr:hypothetical protein AG1IA_08333 [Rhizoctonia solani AG-1 IA]